MTRGLCSLQYCSAAALLLFFQIDETKTVITQSFFKLEASNFHGSTYRQYPRTKPCKTIPNQTKPYQTKENNSKMAITQSFFKLEDPNFA